MLSLVQPFPARFRVCRSGVLAFWAVTRNTMQVEWSLASRCCSAIVHGHTLGMFASAEVERDIEVLEIWAGVGSIARAAGRRGMRAETIDKDHGSETSNLLTSKGFLHAINLVLRLKIGGLLWMAPVCSSFVWLSSSHAKRGPENDFRGDQTQEFVQEGNLGAEIAMFLFVLAWSRGCHAAVENPVGSKFWHYPAFRQMAEHMPTLTSSVVHRCAFDTRDYGDRLGKAYKVHCTEPWILSARLAHGCTCPRREHRKMVKRVGDKVWGLKSELSESQAYPDALGEAVIAAWQEGGCQSQSSGSSGGASSAGVGRPRSSRWAPESDDDADACASPCQASKRTRLMVSSSSDDACDAPPPPAQLRSRRFAPDSGESS